MMHSMRFPVCVGPVCVGRYYDSLFASAYRYRTNAFNDRRMDSVGEEAEERLE